MKAIISQPNTSINEPEGTFFGKGWADGEGGREGREVVPCIDNPPKSVEANHYIEKNTDYFLGD